MRRIPMAMHLQRVQLAAKARKTRLLTGSDVVQVDGVSVIAASVTRRDLGGSKAPRKVRRGAPALLQQPGAGGQPEDPEGAGHGQIMGGESEALE